MVVTHGLGNARILWKRMFDLVVPKYSFEHLLLLLVTMSSVSLTMLAVMAFIFSWFVIAIVEMLMSCTKHKGDYMQPQATKELVVLSGYYVAVGEKCNWRPKWICLLTVATLNRRGRVVRWMRTTLFKVKGNDGFNFVRSRKTFRLHFGQP